MATRSGPTECPDHVLAKHQAFEQELKSFPSPYALYYFDETAPNNILLANDLNKKGLEAMSCNVKPDNQRIPKRDASGPGGEQLSREEKMKFGVRKMFFDVDDIRVPQDGTGLKMLPSYSTSYRNYPAVCYDVVTPHHYQQFFSKRQRPGMFA